jgi:hypothetical protein
MLNAIPKRVFGYWGIVRRQEPSKLVPKVSIPKRGLTILIRNQIPLLASNIHTEDTS